MIYTSSCYPIACSVPHYIRKVSQYLYEYMKWLSHNTTLFIGMTICPYTLDNHPLQFQYAFHVIKLVKISLEYVYRKVKAINSASGFLPFFVF